MDDGANFHPIGLSNTGSLGFDWPGIDRAASPTFDEVLAVMVTVGDCVRVVWEEEFEHLRYARRDLP